MTDELQNIPEDQQEEEDDLLLQGVSFKEAVVQNADWTIETIATQIDKGNIDLHPEFQRRVAWDEVRKSRLIESVIVGMPVPNIVLAENKGHRGKFIVIDGKQRLVAIQDFLKDGYRLRGLDMRPDLNGKLLNQLPPDDRDYLENATLRSTLIRNWGSESLLYAIFFRLNSGSLPLSPQELRRALLGGQLLDLIDNYILQSAPFRELFGDRLDKRMRDSELVLRFLAFDDFLVDYRGDFKELLDTTVAFYENNWAGNAHLADTRLQRLDLALSTSFHVFGGDAFKKWLGDKYERVINRAIFDCVARFFADDTVRMALPGNEAAVRAAFNDTCQESDFRSAIEKTTKSVTATNCRVDRWGGVLAGVLGLTYDKGTKRVV